MDLEAPKVIVPFVSLDEEDPIPAVILDDIREHTRSIWWSLLVLNGSCLWAYYSCLSAPTYYAARFASTLLRFEYLTTPVSTWPMFFGHLVQVVFGFDKRVGVVLRARVGYALYVLAALAIVLQDVISVEPEFGGIVVLVAFGTVGLTNSPTEATFYALSALFPEAVFTNAMQLGNGTSGILNITLHTLLQLVVGGIAPAEDTTAAIQRIAFYIFGIFIAVCLVVVVLYHRLLAIPCVAYLVERNAAETAMRTARHESLRETWARLGRITRVLLLPLASQCLVFVCSLVSFPGIGIAAGYQLAAMRGANLTPWYLNGILLCYNYGDFVRRVVAPKLYPWFTLQSAFWWTLVRFGLFVALLVGLPGGGANPLYCLSGLYSFNVFCTITTGLGPRLLPQQDRESAGAIMCLGLFLGICTGSTLGFEFGQNHWLGA
ncbi:Equilibrative Nucleoside Transporter (ENT) Family [Achlya hypogyna]|uniref:Equilibrative Nucleoside Transporter (ENT) Family n=1 Tax=Achlya hypogyna TaxID=1202772 RepID=A0A1V9YGE0_ACHHY|nr:Equilibrative Nucleoside Transporter (ENT) Family [Achlya hypogyna]